MRAAACKTDTMCSGYRIALDLREYARSGSSATSTVDLAIVDGPARHDPLRSERADDGRFGRSRRRHDRLQAGDLRSEGRSVDRSPIERGGRERADPLRGAPVRERLPRRLPPRGARRRAGVIWTLSEPVGRAEWWPCKDRPDDKADSLDRRSPRPRLDGGDLERAARREEIDTGTDRVTYHWAHRYPIATYLVCVDRDELRRGSTIHTSTARETRSCSSTSSTRRQVSQAQSRTSRSPARCSVSSSRPLRPLSVPRGEVRPYDLPLGRRDGAPDEHELRSEPRSTATTATTGSSSTSWPTSGGGTWSARPIGATSG